jgi:SsrA-binding protein
VSRKPDRPPARKPAAAKERAERRVIASNRRARHDYEILSHLEAGLILLGSEVKSLRTNGATLAEGFARVDRGELWLHQVTIPQLPQASYLNHESQRSRKCLVHRRELQKLETALEAEGLTVVPLSLYFLGHRVKVELGVGRGRKKGDRRQAEREKEDRRRIREHSL